MEETVNYSQLTKERTIYFRDGTTSSMKLYMGVAIAPEKMSQMWMDAVFLEHLICYNL